MRKLITKGKKYHYSRIEDIETPEQFNDYYKHFLLYYGKDQSAMRDHMKAKRKEQRTTTRVTRVVKVRILEPSPMSSECLGSQED